MQLIETTETDSTAGVVPAPQAVAPWRVLSAEPLAAMCLRVTFFDGTAGEVRLETFLAEPRVAGSVFEPLRDPHFFRQVRIDLGAVAWPNGAELAPDAMYDAIRAKGFWAVEE